MLFDLIDVPAIFQIYINKILTEKLDVCCIVYLNDIIIYSKNFAQHVNDVRGIF